MTFTLDAQAAAVPVAAIERSDPPAVTGVPRRS
jgi:hypothetical protein